MLFLCSPGVLNMDDLNLRGLFLTDINLHDAKKDLVLLSEHFESEYLLRKYLEILIHKLWIIYHEHEDKKYKKDKYIHI